MEFQLAYQFSWCILILNNLTKNWKFCPKAPAVFLNSFPEYPEIIKQILYCRGIDTEAKINEFFNPDYDQDLFDPFLFLEMKKAARRIFQAIKKQEKIVVYGDYDADGVTGALIVLNTLKFLGSQQARFYLPDRDKEGYGLNKSALNKFLKEKVKLLITVDCGVSTVEEVQIVQKNGMDVIITDHHAIGPKLPPAFAMIHAKNPKDKYPFQELTGAGMAFKLAQALLRSQTKNKTDKNHSSLQIAFEKWLLDLTAVGTVADCADLIGENRTLVKYGLIVLNKTARPGLRALIQQSGAEIGKLNAWHIGFQIAPRINAAGRMDHANTAFYLLGAKKIKYAKKMAQKLERQNKSRQDLVKRIETEAIAEFQKNNKNFFFLAKNKNWPIGVCGLAASRIVEKINRPCFICEEKKGIIKCSGRSIKKFNLVKALQKCAKFLENFGGHSQAAGFALKPLAWEKFYAKIKELVQKDLNLKDLTPTLTVDVKITAQAISWKTFDWLKRMEPFGMGNPRPRFLIKNLRVEEIKIIGRDKNHLKLKVCENKKSDSCRIFDAIGFALGSFGEKIKKGKIIDLIFELDVNEWNGRRDLQLKIVDLKCR